MWSWPRLLKPMMAMRMSPFAPGAAARLRAETLRAARERADFWRKERRVNIGGEGRLRFGFCVFGVAGGDLGLGRVAFMQEEAVAQGEALVRRDDDVASVGGCTFFHVVLAERVCREEAVIARVPARRVLHILRMIEDGDAERFPLHWTGVIDPRGPFSADLGVL